MAETASTPEVMQAELNKLRQDENWPEKSFIRALCQSFMDKALAYCEVGGPPAERLQRLAEVSFVFRGITLGGLKEFSTAAEQIEVIGADGKPTLDYRCPKGQQCIDGNCI